MLSADQVATYRRDGYVAADGAVALPPPYRNASFFEVQKQSEDEA